MAIINKGQVLYQGRPQDAIAQLNGRIWQISIAKNELADFENRYNVVSTKLIGGRPFLHIFSDSPLTGAFAPAAPDLEDVFFTKIRSLN
jgi:hypothetical protein